MFNELDLRHLIVTSIQLSKNSVTYWIQWNLYKADTIGAKKMCPFYRDVRLIEIVSRIV